MKKPSVLPLHCVASGHIGFRGNGAKQRGVAILEVIIAFFVLAIGLLGLAALQVKSVQFNQGSYQRSQATVAAYDMMDRMRLNRLAASGGAYNMAWTSAGAGTGTVPKDDKTAWVARITSSLPNGEGYIDCDANKICTVSVRWTDRFAATAGVTESLSISSQLL